MSFHQTQCKLSMSSQLAVMNFNQEKSTCRVLTCSQWLLTGVRMTGNEQSTHQNQWWKIFARFPIDSLPIGSLAAMKRVILASSSASSDAGSEDSSEESSSSTCSEEPAPMMPCVRNLSWNQLQSLEVDRGLVTNLSPVPNLTVTF